MFISASRSVYLLGYVTSFFFTAQNFDREADRLIDSPFKGCPAYADPVTVSKNFGRLSVRLYGSQHY
ncbi:hypothetical protein BpHYR1_050081 [Brachionus plicatilis]|uniref:Uncharacterized protein n=1 Tax=Brachionus plicatilis TaxID=10195 RepID=A0A3M7R7P9_BRAPC|nr:hypothetical protein BpHYR1_050081 [Brachionus plicatilis]